MYEAHAHEAHSEAPVPSGAGPSPPACTGGAPAAGRGLARRAVEAARVSDPERERSEACAAGCRCAGVDLRRTPAGGRYVGVLIGEPCPPRGSEGHRAGASVPGRPDPGPRREPPTGHGRAAPVAPGAGPSPPRPGRARRQPSLRSVPCRWRSGQGMPADNSDGPFTASGNARVEAREAIARCGILGSARVALGSAHGRRGEAPAPGRTGLCDSGRSGPRATGRRGGARAPGVEPSADDCGW